MNSISQRDFTPNTTEEHIVSLRHIHRFVDNQRQDWIIVDLYDLDREPDLSIKLKLALVEAGMTRQNSGYYEKHLTNPDPNHQYREVVEKLTASFKSMIEIPTQVVAEKEFGRDDRDSIIIRYRKS